MIKICMKNEKGNLGIKFKLTIILLILALTALAGYGTVAYAASGTNLNARLQDDRGIFDPFTYGTIFVMAENGSNASAVISSVVLRPPIRITKRPVLRSYFRPPLVLP